MNFSKCTILRITRPFRTPCTFLSTTFCTSVFTSFCASLCLIYSLLIHSSSAADAITSFVVQNPSSDPAEVLVQFKYTLSCKGQEKVDQVRGYVLFQGRRTIVDFYLYRNELEIALGAASSEPQEAILELEYSSDCRLDSLQGQVEYENVKITGRERSRELIRKLALIHSPFINLRENQYDHPITDTPLILAYSVHRGESNRVEGKPGYNRILRYTVFLSDEDNQRSSSDTNAQMARYGRTTDIEWIYDVELDANLQVVRESYQGMLHFPFTFRGGYLPSQSTFTHPVLFNYNLADNNVFVDTTEAWFDHFSNPKQKSRSIGHHLVPRIRMDSPQARERVMFANPWTFKVSEAELQRQNKPAISPKDQLFVLVRGKMNGGSFLGKITSTLGEVFVSGGSPCNSWYCNITGLGADLWGQEGFTAIPVGEHRLNLIGTSGFSGEFHLWNSIFINLELKRLRFFRLRDLGQTYGVEEISSKFHCEYRAAETVCQF